jgi:hypothetical protein
MYIASLPLRTSCSCWKRSLCLFWVCSGNVSCRSHAADVDRRVEAVYHDLPQYIQWIYIWRRMDHDNYEIQYVHSYPVYVRLSVTWKCLLARWHCINSFKFFASFPLRRSCQQNVIYFLTDLTSLARLKLSKAFDFPHRLVFAVSIVGTFR